MLFDKLDFYLRNKLKFSRKNFEPDFEINIEALYVKSLLEKYLGEMSFKPDLKVLDIGSKNWCYVRGEWDFFSEKSPNMCLTGIELDAYRLNIELYSRLEIAKGYIKNLKNTTYIADNLLNHKEKYDCIIWILPFVLKPTHLAWGLPTEFFQPKIMLKHAFNLLNDDGIMLIVNQGKYELNSQKKLYNKLKIKFEEKGEFTKEPFKESRFITMVSKSL